MSEWQYKRMRPQDIVAAPQVRTEHDPKKQEELNASVKGLGVLSPLLVMPSGQLLAGHRRLTAALAAGLEAVPVIVTDRLLPESDIRRIQLVENMQRADLTDGEKAAAFQELLRLNPDWTNKQLAARLGLSEPTVSKYLAPARCVPAVREALAAGRIGIAACYEISRADADQQPGLLAQALAGTSRDELAAKVRKPRKSSSIPQARVRRLVCPLPSGVSVTLAGTDLSLDDGITALGEAVREMKRARELGYTAKTFTAAMRDKARKDTPAGAAD